MGGRALLAFWALEKDESGSYTEECELGADLELERLNALIEIRDMLLAFFEGRARAAKKKPPPNG